MPSRDLTARWQRLGIAIVAIAFLWGIVLPRLEQVPSVQARMKHLEDQGIDPAALFYSDHEGMDRWEANIRESRRHNPEAFW